MAGNSSAARSAFSRFENDDGFAAICRDLNKFPALTEAEPFNVEGNDLGVSVFGKIAEQVRFADHCFIADADTHGHTDPLAREFDQLVNQDAAALTD